MSKIVAVLGALVLGVIIAFATALVSAFPVMWLWNWLMPGIFGLPLISFWQALGLSALSSLLIRSKSEGAKS